MEIPDLNAMPGSSTGALGFFLATTVAAVVAFRKYFRSEKVATASTAAEINLISSLSDQLDKANARAAAESMRADLANKERNDLVRELGDLRATVGELTAEVRMLKEKFSAATI